MYVSENTLDYTFLLKIYIIYTYYSSLEVNVLGISIQIRFI